MSKVKIVCYVSNSFDVYQVYLSIMDSEKRVKIEKDIWTNQKIELELEEGIYQVSVISNCHLFPQRYKTTLIVTECEIFLPIYFRDTRIFPLTPIKVYLKERNYPDLKVERGTINLWIKPTQLTSPMVAEQNKS